jgi:hypothetical protein
MTAGLQQLAMQLKDSSDRPVTEFSGAAKETRHSTKTPP